MAKTKFKLNPDFERYLLTSPDLAKWLEVETTRVAEIAKKEAPDDPVTGAPDLRSGIEHKIEVGPRGLVGRIYSRNWKTHFFMWGTSRMRAIPFLYTAMEKAGYRVNKKGR